MKDFFKKFGKLLVSHKAITITVSVVLILAIVAIGLYFGLFRVAPYDGEDRQSVGYVPTLEQVNNAVKYERVVIFGVDGAGAYFGEGVTPNFERIFSNGSVTYNGVSQSPTISAENWAAMFTGVHAQKHKITNARASILPYNSSKYPTIFKILSERNPDATFSSYVDWTQINTGMIENDIDNMNKRNVKLELGNSADSIDIANKIADLVIERLDVSDDMVTFMQFDAVDHEGHAGGYGCNGFVNSLIEVDKCIGRIYDAYVSKGLLETTLFICVSDHGHTLSGGHGGNQPTEVNTTFAVRGDLGNIISGTPTKYVTNDLPAVVLYALGEVQPDSYEARVPYNLFNTLG